MSETTLPKLGLNKIDKLCSADIVRQLFKSTKKDFALFVSENEDLLSFFQSLEEKIDETNAEYLEMIREYMESIPDEINAFKLKIKELERKRKIDEKARQKEIIKQEILKEMEAEKRKAELQEKLGIKPTPSKEEDSEEETPAEEDEQEKKIKFFTKGKKLNEKKPSEKPNAEKSNPEKSSDKPDYEKINDKNIKNLEDNLKQNVMDLGMFFAFLKEVVKNDLLIIKSDEGRMTVKDLDLDDDKIRIKVSKA